jgi:hypothetical protein
MANDHEFLANTWATGDFIELSKMIQHIENEDYLEERTDVKCMVLGTYDSEPYNSSGLAVVTTDLLVDGASLVSGGTAGSTFHFKNIDLVGYGKGIHTVKIGGANTFKFYLPQDHDRISASGESYDFWVGSTGDTENSEPKIRRWSGVQITTHQGDLPW